MTRMKVMTIVGTRPEIVRLSRVMAAIDRHTDHAIVHTGQNYDYELNQVFFDDLELRPPDHYLDAAGADGGGNDRADHHSGRTACALGELRPDAVLILGDTDGWPGGHSSQPAEDSGVPHGGRKPLLRQRVPEEMNRPIVDHVADINLPYSAISARYLLREGLPPTRCYDREPDVGGAAPLQTEDGAVRRAPSD